MADTDPVTRPNRRIWWTVFLLGCALFAFSVLGYFMGLSFGVAIPELGSPYLVAVIYGSLLVLSLLAMIVSLIRLFVVPRRTGSAV